VGKALAGKTKEPEPIERLRARVSGSEPESYCELAWALRDLGTPQARAEAANLFLRAAQLDHPSGHFAAAIEARALDVRWLNRVEMALYRPYLNAAKEMGTDLFGLASYHLEEAIEAGFDGAEQLYAQWKVEGFDNFKDDAEALALLEEAAAAGNNSARYQLAVRLLGGRAGVAPDPKAAVQLLEKAADEGYAGAICRLGICYLTAEGVEKDGTLALRLLNHAADLGRSDAWLALGWIHAESGDAKEAARHFQESAELGNRAAMYHLARLQETGTGLRKDETAARRLMVKAARAGHPEAAFAVANYHASGRRNFKRDSNLAAYWYRQAAHSTVDCEGTCTLYERGARKEGEQRWELRERPSSAGVAEARVILRAMIDREEVAAEPGDDILISQT
jgi:TPR repeat protein